MRIVDDRNTTPSEVEITEVKLSPEWFRTDTGDRFARPRLHLKLQPLPQERPRGVNSSYEPRKGVPSALTISFEEFEALAAAVHRELHLAYQVLAKRDLLDEVGKPNKPDRATAA